MPGAPKELLVDGCWLTIVLRDATARDKERQRQNRKCQPLRGPVAQLAEQQTLNLLVVGSIPTGLTTLFLKKVRVSAGPGDSRSLTDTLTDTLPTARRASPLMTEHGSVAGRYVVPTHVLRRRPAEAIALGRLGALANAMVSVAGWAATSVSTGVGRDRDTQQSGLVFLSYLKEAIEVLDRPVIWDLIEKGVAAGYRLPRPLAEYRATFSRNKSSAYQRVLIDLRNKKGFHVLEEHFQKWIDELNAPEVTLLHKDGSSPLDWAFTASMQVQSFFGVQLDAKTLSDLQHSPELFFVVEALAAGMMADAGIAPATGWRPVKYQLVQIRYEFADGRPSESDSDYVAVDVGGRIAGTGIKTLLEKFYARFGGREHTGYVLSPASGGLMTFSATGRGSAHVEADGPLLPSPPKPPEMLLTARLRDAASRGEQQALTVLSALERLRAGTLTAIQAATVIQRMISDVDYWRKLQTVADDAAKAERDRRASASNSKESDTGNSL